MLGLAAVGVVAILALGVVLVRARQTLGTIQQDDPRRNQQVMGTQVAFGSSAQQDTVAPSNLSTPFNVLLIGVDKRENPDEGVRSDTLIVVHLDPQQKWASMLSIPRDSIVNIPGFGFAKINTAYSNGYMNAEAIYGAGTSPDAGGGALAAQTVEQFLGITIDYVAQVDFHGFEQLVDALGGVTLDIEKPLLDAEYPTENYGVERIYIPAGLQVLDGRTALMYARSRHGSDDFGRGQRQQLVLRALLSEVRSRGLLENVTTWQQWADVLTQNVRTTLPIQDPAMLAGLASLARELDGERITQLSINPNDVGFQENGSDIYWDEFDLKALVTRWLQGPQATDSAPLEVARVQVLNGASVDGIAGRVSDTLNEQGFSMVAPTTAGQSYPNSWIIDYTGRPETRQRLATALGIDPRFVQDAPGPEAPPQTYEVDILVVVGQDYQQWWKGE